MDLQQMDIETSPGMVDSTRMFFDTVGNARFIFGSSRSAIPVPRFYFIQNPTTGNFEARDVSIKDRTEKVNGIIISASQYTAEELNRDLVSRFFTPDEDFYINTLQTSSRGFSAEEKKVKMYLTIVANTNDPEIGKGCVFDITRASELFENIAKFMGITVIKKVVSGKTYNKANVESAIRQLNPGKNDIVVFYYTGHGFRKESDKRDFPYIDLRPKPDKTYMINSLNIEDIFNTVRKKSKAARLNLVISDCCNTLPETRKPNSKAVGGFRDIKDWSEENVRQLFLNPTPQSVLITAAGVGQEAACDTTAGSLFTIYFKAAIENNLTRFKSRVAWRQIVAEAQSSTSFKARHTYCKRPFIPENICSQDPLPKFPD